jgi:hypothetical protein
MLIIKRLNNFIALKKYKVPETKQTLFQNIWYLETFAKHFCQESEIILLGIFKEKEFIGYGAFERVENKILLLGMKPILKYGELTDYGGIYFREEGRSEIVEVWRKIWQWFKQSSFSYLELDYLREDSQLYKAIGSGEPIFDSQNSQEQEVSPYIDLPKTWDEYLASLGRKDRKELKRKMKRLNTVENFHICRGETLKTDFDEFIRLHRLSDPRKKKFMSEEMKAFFWDLFRVKKDRWKTNLCFLRIDNKNVAALMTFEFEDEILAYNSGYDPQYNYYSVGLLLHAFKIKQAVEEKKKIYDFLRGEERYKYDLGAKNLKLYKVVISRR